MLLSFFLFLICFNCAFVFVYEEYMVYFLIERGLNVVWNLIAHELSQ